MREDDRALAEDTYHVVFLQVNHPQNGPMYVYLSVQHPRLPELLAVIRDNRDFEAEQLGEIIFAGYGHEPDEELQDYLQVVYGIFHKDAVRFNIQSLEAAKQQYEPENTAEDNPYNPFA